MYNIIRLVLDDVVHIIHAIGIQINWSTLNNPIQVRKWDMKRHITKLKSCATVIRKQSLGNIFSTVIKISYKVTNQKIWLKYHSHFILGENESQKVTHFNILAYCTQVLHKMKGRKKFSYNSKVSITKILIPKTIGKTRH